MTVNESFEREAITNDCLAVAGDTEAASYATEDTHASTIAGLLQFWFGEDVFAAFPSHKTRYWFDNWVQALSKIEQQEHRALIKQNFSCLIADAANGGLQEWRHDSHRGLALILLLDRLAPRILSNRTVIRECNRLAVDCCRVGLSTGLLQELTIVERCFYLAPLTTSRREELRRQAVRFLEDQLTQANDPDSPEHAHRGLVQLHLFNAVKNQQRKTATQACYAAPRETLVLSA